MPASDQKPKNSENVSVVLMRSVQRLACATARSGRVIVSTFLCLLSAVVFAADAGAPAAVPQRCEWIEGTLVPQGVIGVRRLGDAVDGDEAVDFLDVYSEPTGGVRVGRAKLFRPYFVTRGGAGAGRVRIQEGYHDPPIGWVDRGRLEFLESRYAYVFAQPDQPGKAELHDTSKEAYERHLAQLKNEYDAKTAESVILRQRPKAEPWLPVTRQDPVPFIELLEQSLATARDEPDYPDTTPTFQFGFPAENRLLHMGAICGGPVNVELLADLKEKVKEQAGLEMLFVIDETSSMRPYFEGVAAFIEDAGAVVGRPQGLAAQLVRVGVTYYSDGPRESEWFRWSTALGQNQPGLVLMGKGDAAELARDVQTNEDKLPPDDFSDAPERSLEALRRAIETAGFSEGASKYVAIIGDTGYEADPEGADNLAQIDAQRKQDRPRVNSIGKQKLIEAIAEEIERNDLTIFFVHVGDRKTSAQGLFKDDADAVRAALGEKAKGRVSYITAEEKTLAEELGKARDKAEALRWRRERDIARMESRNQATEPGPKLIDRLGAQKMKLEQYENSHLQYFVPARGWLYQPAESRSDIERVPQFTELLFLAPAERRALISLLKHCRERLAKNLAVDGSKAVAVFAESLAAETGDPEVVEEALAQWQAIPEAQQRIGVFLEDKLGLRIKATLPFPPDGYREDQAEETPENPHATHEFWRALLRVEKLLDALKAADDEAFWFDAASLVP